MDNIYSFWNLYSNFKYVLIFFIKNVVIEFKPTKAAGNRAFQLSYLNSVTSSTYINHPSFSQGRDFFFSDQRYGCGDVRAVDLCGMAVFDQCDCRMGANDRTKSSIQNCKQY